MNFVRIRSSILGPRHEPATEAALQSPLERVAFTTFRLPLKYRFSLNQAKRMSAFRSRFDQLLYEHFYDARLLQHFFLSGLLILSSAFAPPYRSAARGAPKCA